MKAIEFRTDVSEGDIVIPKRLQSRLAHLKGRKVRVMLCLLAQPTQLRNRVQPAAEVDARDHHIEYHTVKGLRLEQFFSLHDPKAGLTPPH